MAKKKKDTILEVNVQEIFDKHPDAEKITFNISYRNKKVTISNIVLNDTIKLGQ